MEKWFENLAVTDTGSKGYNEHQAQFLQLAYRNTFTIEDDGKQVLCHLCAQIEEIKKDDAMHPEAVLAVIGFFDTILNNSGIIKDYRFIEAIAGSARLIETKKETKTEREL